MLALRPGRTPERRAPVVAANHPPVIVARVSAAPPPARRRVARRVARPIVPATPTPEPLIVKLQTDDPNVVIYWIADRKRGE
jgi:hypothetical protein